MPKIIEVIYEDGVFKPLEKVELKEGERVKIEVKKIELESLRGKYKSKMDLKLVFDEIHDRRTHIH